MKRLDPKKLHTIFLHGVASRSPLTVRRYTLTHSDSTGELFLSIGLEYNKRQVSGWYKRLMRDEVLAEWKKGEMGHTLRVHLHVSGGFVFGRAGWREAIFRRELPLVLESIRYGDRDFFTVHPELDQTPIYVHFQSPNLRYDRIDQFGVPSDYL